MVQPPRQHVQPISRAEAAQCGLSRFYTGKSCRAGHVAERYVGNRQCVVCNAEKTRLRERRKDLLDHPTGCSVTSRDGHDRRS